jgi:hypothetical protein
LPVTPISQVLLQLSKPLQDEIILEGGIKLYLNPEFSPEWNATVSGQIAAKPIGISYSKFNEAISDAEEVVFSYSVVNEREYGADADHFQPEIEGNEYFQKYVNPKGEKLAIVAMPRVISIQWAGYYIDKFGELIDGYVGDEAGMSRWKAQFNFGFTSEYSFKNLIEWEGADYWKCDVADVFAKKVNGKLLPVGDRLIMEPMVFDIKRQIEVEQGKPMPYQTVTFIPHDRATMIHDCEELDIQAGDVISFDPRFCEKYKIDGKDYFLIKKNRAQGKWQES